MCGTLGPVMHMKDLPIFTTEYGAASLILREIVPQGKAYIRLQATSEPEKLAAECRDFCRVCGAEEIFAAGHSALAAYPVETVILELHCRRSALPDTDAALWPVQTSTLEDWRAIYNRKVRAVPAGAWMTLAEGQAMLQKGDGYFVHRGKTLLGIGRASVNRIDWVAAVTPGGGRDVVLALNHLLTEETAVLTVAAANRKAMALYESLGFLPTRELERWYRLR